MVTVGEGAGGGAAAAAEVVSELGLGLSADGVVDSVDGLDSGELLSVDGLASVDGLVSVGAGGRTAWLTLCTGRPAPAEWKLRSDLRKASAVSWTRWVGGSTCVPT